MLKLEIGISNKHLGFTLIEILVVLVIIGITMTFAMLAFGDFGASRRVLLATEQFVNFVNLTEQQAILETNTLGIFVDSTSYQVYRLTENGTWNIFPSNSIFRRYYFPAQATLKLDSDISSSNSPQIIVNESGDMNPFQLTVLLKNKEITRVIGEHNGNMHIEKKGQRA